ncbi:MAG: hypothetical protein IPM59_12120 [Chloracidobacterium sp.]|nr:hypothetical protein [Chloracidobacterium sp.]
MLSESGYNCPRQQQGQKMRGDDADDLQDDRCRIALSKLNDLGGVGDRRIERCEVRQQQHRGNHQDQQHADKPYANRFERGPRRIVRAGRGLRFWLFVWSVEQMLFAFHL